ncbi:MAG TPA: hypothetical protein VFE41_28090 [Acetobacteraceae bacterium]|nr:hypothetical protein [Acetobacteraceae bacterium]
MIARRILAILAAAFLVGAVAVALLGPPGMPLGQALLAIDHRVLDVLQSAVERAITPWLWSEVILPVLIRPAWLLPAGLGLICAGLSFTLPQSRRAERPGQRRF